jgi:hypothetical protein
MVFLIMSFWLKLYRAFFIGANHNLGGSYAGRSTNPISPDQQSFLILQFLQAELDLINGRVGSSPDLKLS